MLGGGREERLPQVRIVLIPTFQCNNIIEWVHNSRVSSDGSSLQALRVVQVDDDDLVLFSHLFSNTNVLFRLHCQVIKSNVCCIYAKRLQLEKVVLVAGVSECQPCSMVGS